MNLLQRYLDLRGITCADIAQRTGYGYHAVQKTVKGLRQGVKIRADIATFLGLDGYKLWGRGAVMYLRAQIALEAGRQAERTRLEILDKYLPADGNIAPKGKAVNG